ncbi:hypothetical protein [Christiangramia crocea]|uniref:Uncharacterized protein n=1 Tax=Christiangramia crocea TaxID=2904124 RepID=A0A9X1UVV6_9FLAO|nr:hypothetical protein [Gramella crocea]MCG9971035.1 hypothetical protein [Gramella crocea]
MTDQQKEIDLTLRKAHEWLYEVVKARKNLSWVKIGKLIGRSDKGASMVFENYSLGLDQIESIADKLGLKEEFERKIKKAPELGAKVSIKDAIRMIINYEEEAEKDPDYQLFIKTIKQKGIIEFLERKK